MAETTQYMFSYTEMVEALVKKQGLHEGLWQIAIEFRLGAATVGPDEAQVLPTALVGVQRIGIQRVEKANNLTVDAAQVNPAAPKATRKPRKPA